MTGFVDTKWNSNSTFLAINQPQSNCMYYSPIDLELNGIPCGSNSMGKWWIQSEFGWFITVIRGRFLLIELTIPSTSRHCGIEGFKGGHKMPPHHMSTWKAAEVKFSVCVWVTDTTKCVSNRHVYIYIYKYIYV